MPSEPVGIAEAMASVRRSVVVPKAEYNAFGKFRYRSYEAIVAALKEPCAAAHVTFWLTDEVREVAGRHYVVATAHAGFDDGREGEATCEGWAREAEHKSGSDDAQVTGMASSYARKYALCGLFAIDGSSDPDTAEGSPEPRPREPPESGPFVARCRSCGKRFTFEGRDQYLAWLPTASCCPAPDYAVE